jgi:hypothetical protein
VLIVAMALAIAVVGLCLFDGDGHGTSHAPSFDLCIGLAVISVGVTLLALTPVAFVALDSPSGVRAISPRRLDPPPRAIRLS